MEASKPKRQSARKSREVLVKVDYQDESGRKWVVLVPQGREEDAAMGIPVGPPDLKSLELPEEIEIRLNNLLHARGMLTWNDIRHNIPGVKAAILAAIRLDVTRLTNLYREVQ